MTNQNELIWTGEKDNQKADNNNYLLFLNPKGVWKLMNPYYKQWTSHISEQAAKDAANELHEAYGGTL